VNHRDVVESCKYILLKMVEVATVLLVFDEMQKFFVDFQGQDELRCR
jgi:hypothetical protein